MEEERRADCALAAPEKQNRIAIAAIVSFFISIFSWSRSGAPCAWAIARLVAQRVRAHAMRPQRAEVLGAARATPALAPGTRARYRRCVGLAFITHPDCRLHEMGPGHPERPERVHDPAYLDALQRLAPSSGLVQLDPDTAMNPHTLQAAQRAAGAAVLGTDLVVGGKAEAAFCAVRPPGHHAERARAMGFCFFNNVAVGAAHALAQHGLERVAVVDFDVHHGNGTEDMFRDDPRVLMVSTFQHPFYPGSGVEGRSDRMVNVPLAAGAGSREFRAAVEQEWLPALDRFRPQMLFISAGFDAHRDDGMAFLRLSDADY